MIFESDWTRDAEGNVRRRCCKCKTGALKWEWYSKTHTCQNSSCGLAMTVFCNEGCHIADWDYLIGSDGDFYFDMDGDGPKPYNYRGYFDDESVNRDIETMRKNEVANDLIERFIEKHRSFKR